MPADFQGGCFCGAVRFRVQNSPRYVNHCHCSMCRRCSGALFVSWATFDRMAFSWTKSAPSYLRSSEAARRAFCQFCGTALTWEPYRDSERLSETLDITLGSLDDPNAFAPTEHIWVANQATCLRFADGLPRRPGNTKSDPL
ncbi:MAG: GFA family protein [Burkholderiales bacterium]